MQSTDLFNWEETKVIDALEAERLELKQRIEQLPKMAHARVALEFRLRQLTLETLRKENEAS